MTRCVVSFSGSTPDGPTILYRKRKAAGLTQQEAADHIGFSVITLNDLEHGRGEIGGDVLKKLLSFYVSKQSKKG